jgi:hypothetical protein
MPDRSNVQAPEFFTPKLRSMLIDRWGRRGPDLAHVGRVPGRPAGDVSRRPTVADAGRRSPRSRPRWGPPGPAPVRRPGAAYQPIPKTRAHAVQKSDVGRRSRSGPVTTSIVVRPMAIGSWQRSQVQLVVFISWGPPDRVARRRVGRAGGPGLAQDRAAPAADVSDDVRVWQRFCPKWAIRPECLSRHGLVESGLGL